MPDRRTAGVDRSRDDALQALIRKTAARAAAAPNADEIGAKISRPRWMSRRDYIDMVSQLYHGETATGAACALLAGRIADPLALRFLDLQRADEARHAAYYATYLDGLGDVAPMDAALQDAVDAAMEWRGDIAGTIAAFNIVLEGEAVHLQRRGAAIFKCPMFGVVTELVGRDEAQHVAFGDLYLRNALPAVSREERRAIYHWLKRGWFSAGPSQRTTRSPMGTAFRVARRRYMEDRWAVHHRSLVRVGLIGDGDRLD